MKRIVEILGFVAPLALGCVFGLSGLVAPFGDAADRAEPALLIAAALLLSSALVGAHLLIQSRGSAIFGIICGLAAAAFVTLSYMEAKLIGTSGYWQVMSGVVLAIAAPAWHFRKPSAEILQTP
ncbi:hypothetical protein [Sphingopyxis sp. H115]|uniref:hypothetical protein n=1 Tax=Sphingopyxis sp. H115 TaxID=1759073 RepID=UPI00128EF569|nr:hypothetical protein [Sphingopyxis sp. H115]